MESSRMMYVLEGLTWRIGKYVFWPNMNKGLNFRLEQDVQISN